MLSWPAHPAAAAHLGQVAGSLQAPGALAARHACLAVGPLVVGGPGGGGQVAAAWVVAACRSPGPWPGLAALVAVLLPPCHRLAAR